MLNEKKASSIFNKIMQVGIVVRDLKKAMDNYLSYGIGPFYVLKFSPDNVSKMYIHGKRLDYAMNIGVCTIGDVRFELIEPLTESIYSEYLDKYGEGIIHHIKISVNDYYVALKYLNSMGIGSLQSGHQMGIKGKNIYNYLDSADDLGFICEIVDVSNDFIKPEPDYFYPEKSDFIPIFKKSTYLGIVVRDLNRKLKIYQQLFGSNNWRCVQYDCNNVEEMRVYGKKKDYVVKIYSLELENMKIVLIEPKGYSIFSDFLDKYEGKTIHHLGMVVKDYYSCLETLKSKGLEIIQSGNYFGKNKYSYLSSNKNLGYFTKIYNNEGNIGKK